MQSSYGAAATWNGLCNGVILDAQTAIDEAIDITEDAVSWTSQDCDVFGSTCARDEALELMQEAMEYVGSLVEDEISPALEMVSLLQNLLATTIEDSDEVEAAAEEALDGILVTVFASSETVMLDLVAPNQVDALNLDIGGGFSLPSFTNFTVDFFVWDECNGGSFNDRAYNLSRCTEVLAEGLEKIRSVTGTSLMYLIGDSTQSGLISMDFAEKYASTSGITVDLIAFTSSHSAQEDVMTYHGSEVNGLAPRYH